MKKIYEAPTSEMTVLSTSDIITDSLLDAKTDGFDDAIIDINPT